jgi:hypothetical protein
LQPVLFFLWCLALAVYGLKLLMPKWDAFTRFGKLEIDEPWIVSVPNKLGWILFYAFSCIMFGISWLVIFPPGLSNILLVAHSFRRLIESVMITKFAPRKMHLINFSAGLLFYAMSPLTLAYSNRVKDFELPRFVNNILVVVVVILHCLQYQVHTSLASLKKYSIPQGVLFNRLACPHYTIEIVCYFIYFLLAPNGLSFLMAVFVGFNLTHQSILTDRWYCGRFDVEWTSLKRNVLIPYVY